MDIKKIVKVIGQALLDIADALGNGDGKKKD